MNGALCNGTLILQVNNVTRGRQEWSRLAQPSRSLYLCYIPFQGDTLRETVFCPPFFGMVKYVGCALGLGVVFWESVQCENG